MRLGSKGLTFSNSNSFLKKSDTLGGPPVNYITRQSILNRPGFAGDC